MTSWNPFSIFSVLPGAGADLDGGVSSSFDPSRTGDPHVHTFGRPAIGFGDVQVGGAGTGVEPRRRPIGFAPPADDESPEPRYRTELSFKRHHDVPVASSAPPTGPDEQGDTSSAWRTPESGAADVSPRAADEAAAADEKVPFYKREIGFKRKRDTAEAAKIEEATSDEPVVDVPVADEPEAEAPVARGEADDNVPFYKRELSFRRKHDEAAGESVSDEVEKTTSDEPHTDEPQADEPVAQEAAADEPEAQEALADEPVAVEEPVEEPAAQVQDPADVAPVAEAPADLPAEPKDDDASRSEGGGAVVPMPKRGLGRGARGRRLVGLKIGASQLAAAVVASDGSNQLVQLARRPLESGIVVDGEVKDVSALTAAVKAFFDENKLPKGSVRIGLASNRIGVRTLDIVGIDDETRFDNAVRFKAHEVLPVAVNESVLDYRVLEERTNEAGESSRRVLLVVAPRDQVEPYTQVAAGAGLKLEGVDLEALGLLRAFVDPKPFAVRAVDDTATVIVAIGHESTTLLVAGGGACEFTRVFDWGGGSLQDAIAQALDVHGAEAATILRHLSLSGPGRQLESLDETARAKALDAVRLRLTPFARELVSSLQFYQTQPESLGIGEIVITGGTSHLEGLGDALHQMIGVNVRSGNPLGRVVVTAAIDPAIDITIGSMAVPIGLAIDDIAMRGVNLLPPELKKARGARPDLLRIAIPVAAAVPLAALGFLFVGAHGKAADKQRELDAVKSEIAALPTPTGPVIDASIVGTEAVRATAVANVLGGRIAWENVLGDISRVLPQNVWLKSLSAKEPATATATGTTAVAATTAAGAPPTGVTIDGYTYSQPDVARLLARLATLPSITNVTLQSSQTEIVGKKDVFHFVILADLNQTGGSR